MDKKIFELSGKYGFYLPIVLILILGVLNIFLHNHLITFIRNGLGWVLLWNVGSYCIFWIYEKIKHKKRG